MGAVQQPELRQLVGGDIGDHLRAAVFKPRSAGPETILDHPLAEGLRHDRPGVHAAEPLGDAPTVVVGRRRNDAVDHGRRAGDRVGEPSPEFDVAQLGHPLQDAARGRAVARQIVAAQDREWCDAGGAPSPQRLDDEAGGAPRRFRPREIVHDVRVGFDQLTARRIVAVALLRHRQADDLHGGIAHRREQAVRDRRARRRAREAPRRRGDPPASGPARRPNRALPAAPAHLACPQTAG